MEGDKRREEIIHYLADATQPLSGTVLAKNCNVSRQVIVQDIALLRATNKNILSTNKGYILYDPLNNLKSSRKSLYVHHDDSQIQDELYTIVDRGGRVLDVVVDHDVYGQITCDLVLKNRSDVDEFIEKLHKSNSQPLKALTGGNHFHTIEAESEEIIASIERDLILKGYMNKL